MNILLGLLLFGFVVFFIIEICIAAGGFLWLKLRQHFCRHVDNRGFSVDVFNQYRVDRRWDRFKCQKCGKVIERKKI